MQKERPPNFMTAGELMDQQFLPRSAIVEGFLPVGTYILAGAPKCGKYTVQKTEPSDFPIGAGEGKLSYYQATLGGKVQFTRAQLDDYLARAERKVRKAYKGQK